MGVYNRLMAVEMQIFAVEQSAFPERTAPRREVALGGRRTAVLTETEGDRVRSFWLLVAATVVYFLWLFVHWLLLPDFFVRLPALLNELVQLGEIGWLLTLLVVWGLFFWWRKESIAGAFPEMDLAELYALDPADFEKYIGVLFRRKGYKVQVRGRSGDLGVDLMLTRPGGKKAIVQCKRYRHTVGAKVVRELYGTLIHEKVSHAFLVTTAEISGAARNWAQGKPITLIDGATLADVVAALSGSEAEPATQR